MSQEYSLRPQVRFISLEYTLCHKSTVLPPRVQFMSLEDSLCPQSTVYVPRVQFVSPSTIYISGVHFMSQE